MRNNRGCQTTTNPNERGIQVKDKDRSELDKRRRRIRYRLNGRRGRSSHGPATSGGRSKLEMAGRTVATKAGGVAAVDALVKRLGLPRCLNACLDLLKRYQPYTEADHILSLAYNVLVGGTCLQDLDLLREDEAFMNMLNARRLPDPTTAGDFLRRFEEADILQLQYLVNEIRAQIWRQQPDAFRQRAYIDADGVVVGTTGEKKEGMDRNHHKQIWGYHPLIVSLANTREPLFLMNRSGNVPSHQGAAAVIDDAIALTRGVFDEVYLRGDTDFSLTAHLDRWSGEGVLFVFGFDAIPKLKGIANGLASTEWHRFERQPKYEVRTTPRAKRENEKEKVVVAKEWKNLILESEDIAEVAYQPGKCSRHYRMIILRKNLVEKRGEQRLFTECRYFFYITNDVDISAEAVVRESNERCDQENLIAQLTSGINALRAPTHDLVSNWAYMVIAALAWTFKAWFGLTLPRSQDRLAVVRMEFKRFLQAIILVPAQVLHSGRRWIVRLLAYTSSVRLLFRSMQATAALTFQ